jgi:hypothetical protein
MFTIFHHFSPFFTIFHHFSPFFRAFLDGSPQDTGEVSRSACPHARMGVAPRLIRVKWLA